MYICKYLMIPLNVSPKHFIKFYRIPIFSGHLLLSVVFNTFDNSSSVISYSILCLLSSDSLGMFLRWLTKSGVWLDCNFV